MLLVILHVVFFVYLFFDPQLWTKTVFLTVILVDLFLFAVGRMAIRKTSFHFSISHIEKINFPVKKYTWDEFANVILKDNLLTLDFKNNRLLQAEIEVADINEEAFNTFAKQQLAKHS